VADLDTGARNRELVLGVEIDARGCLIDLAWRSEPGGGLPIPSAVDSASGKFEDTLVGSDMSDVNFSALFLCL